MVSAVKNTPANAGDAGDKDLIPRLGRSHRGGHGSPLQYSDPENPMDGEDWQPMVHKVAELGTTEVTPHACTFLRLYPGIVTLGVRASEY